MSQDSPRVGIVMGSDSDWPKINKAAAALDEFDVPHEIRVMSAHRTPHAVAQYATSAEERGLGVVRKVSASSRPGAPPGVRRPSMST